MAPPYVPPKCFALYHHDAFYMDCQNYVAGRNNEGRIACAEHGASMNVAVLDARVNWHDGFVNDPSLDVLLNYLPSAKDFKYVHQRGDWLYYAEYQRVAKFFSYSGPGRGFGGAEIVAKLVDGTTDRLIGPWSSNTAAVNSKGYGPVVSVAVATDFDRFVNRSLTGGIALTIPLALQALGCMQGVSLMWSGSSLIPIKTADHRKILGHPSFSDPETYDTQCSDEQLLVEREARS